MVDHESQCHSCDEQEEFGELLKYTGAGFAGGLMTGAVLDHSGFHQSALGQWLVRTLPEKEKACLKASMPSGNACEVQLGQWPRRTGEESCLEWCFRGSSIGEAE